MQRNRKVWPIYRGGRGENQSIETVPEEAQILDLDFTLAVIPMLI